jgi:hypothetical protein
MIRSPARPRKNAQHLRPADDEVVVDVDAAADLASLSSSPSPSPSRPLSPSSSPFSRCSSPPPFSNNPCWLVADLRELHESRVAATPQRAGTWLAYATFESALSEDSCRAVLDRALAHVQPSELGDVLRFFADFERICGHVERARDLHALHTTIDPEDANVWLQRLEFESLFGTVAHERQAYEEWLDRRPDPAFFRLLIAREVYRGDTATALGLCERFVAAHSTPQSWTFYAQLAAELGMDARGVFERAVLDLQNVYDDLDLMSLYAAFAAFIEHENSRQASGPAPQAAV